MTELNQFFFFLSQHMWPSGENYTSYRDVKKPPCLAHLGVYESLAPRDLHCYYHYFNCPELKYLANNLQPKKA